MALASIHDYEFKFVGISRSGKSIYRCRMGNGPAKGYYLTVWAIDSSGDPDKDMTEFSQFNFQFVKVGDSIEAYDTTGDEAIRILKAICSDKRIRNEETSISEILRTCILGHAKRRGQDLDCDVPETMRSSDAKCPLCNGTRIRNMGFYKRDCECILG